MLRKSIALICLFSGISVFPALSQTVRQGESKTEYLDQNGNVIGSAFFSVQVTEMSQEEARKAQREKLLNEKIAIFTKYIGLTTKESERFWPIYNDYSQKRDELAERERKILRQLSNESTMSVITDNEIKALLDSYMMCVEKDGQLQMEFYKKFSTILPAKKVVKIYQAEEYFKQYLLRSLRYGY